MLSERERQELVGVVAKECGTLLRADDPVFATVVLSERVLEHAAGAVASKLTNSLQATFADYENRVRERVEDGVSAELARLMEAGGRARAEIGRAGQRWALALLLVAGLELLGLWLLQRGGWL